MVNKLTVGAFRRAMWRQLTLIVRARRRMRLTRVSGAHASLPSMHGPPSRHSPGFADSLTAMRRSLDFSGQPDHSTPGMCSEVEGLRDRNSIHN